MGDRRYGDDLDREKEQENNQLNLDKLIEEIS